MKKLDLYAILDASPYASAEELKRAYRRQVWRQHPDVVGGGSERMIQINWAYAVLSDPEQRAAYDQTSSMTWTEKIAWTPTLTGTQQWAYLTVLWLMAAAILWLCLEPVNLPALMATALWG